MNSFQGNSVAHAAIYTPTNNIYVKACELFELEAETYEVDTTL